MKVLKNQRGQVMIIVLMLSLFFITSYFAFQAYWNTRLRSLANAREAYNMMDATDKAARDIRASWDAAAAKLGPGATAQQIQTQMTQPGYGPVLNPACSVSGSCTATHCCPTTAVLCYTNPSNSNNPYCFYGTSTTTASLDLRLVVPEEKTSIVKKYVMKTEEIVASFFKNFHTHGVIENKAVALTATIGYRTDSVGYQPICGPSGASCMQCGTGASGLPLCGSIYACPQSFPQCSGYQGSLTPGTGSHPPLFVQQFYLGP